MIEQFGGPEVLKLRDDVPDPEWKLGQALIEVTSAGINYADTHAAANDYLAPQTLPFIPGAEVVGRVVKSPDGKSSGEHSQVRLESSDHLDDANLRRVPQGTCQAVEVARPQPRSVAPDAHRRRG